MSQLDHLMAAVIAAPDEPAPRRAYAAAVKASDSPRARLIELQLERRAQRARGEQPSAESGQEMRALLHRHGARWAGELAGLASYIMFWGGFPEEIEIDAGRLLANAQTIATLAPIRHLRVRGLAGRVGEVATLPQLAKLVSLDVASNRLSDVDIAELVGSPTLRGLRLLRITDNPVGLDAHRAIARARLDALEFVEASQTKAPLVARSSDWDGSIREDAHTRAQAELVAELGSLPWLVALDEPSTEGL